VEATSGWSRIPRNARNGHSSRVKDMRSEELITSLRALNSKIGLSSGVGLKPPLESLCDDLERLVGTRSASPTQAVHWCRKAAEAGDAFGMTRLGLMYENGFGGLPKMTCSPSLGTAKPPQVRRNETSNKSYLHAARIHVYFLPEAS
jgi:TPR repeat protein